MKLPTLPMSGGSREVVEGFRGYNHNLRIRSNELYHMENLTSDHYPVLGPRGKRGIYARPASPQGLIAKDQVCYVDGEDFIIGQERIAMGLSVQPEDCPKQLASMGAYVIILPDKKFINTMNAADRGNIEAVFDSIQPVTIQLCTARGESLQAVPSPTPPENPENLSWWIDTAASPHVLKQWSAEHKLWVSAASTYVKIQTPGIGQPFSRQDGITLTGIVGEGLKDLNGSHVILEKGDDYLILTGIAHQATTQTEAIRVQRRMPRLDFVTESGNRLWGCRYGLDENGQQVNEIYASKLGDFKNWNCFQGLSTDSYAASCGTDGPFTGAVTHLGYPLFWKENCVHKVYGSYPAQYQIQDTACRGVQPGCQGSLAIVNETLFYKSRSGICAYDGALPKDISYPLGTIPYSGAVAGSVGSKYYISMEDSLGQGHLFVFDTGKGMWHREDDLRVLAFCSHGGELYCIDSASRNILALLGSGEPYEQEVAWMAETGELGLNDPDRKYISRMQIRMSLEPGSQVDIYARYDLSPEWIHLARVHSTSLGSFSVPIRPRRCDHMKLRFVGTGMGRIYAWAKTIERGSGLS